MFYASRAISPSQAEHKQNRLHGRIRSQQK